MTPKHDPDSDIWPMLDIREFEAIYTPARGHYHRPMSRQRKALFNLPANKAIVMDHGDYRCKGSSQMCSISSIAYRTAIKRGLHASVKHLPGGKLAVAFYGDGKG